MGFLSKSRVRAELAFVGLLLIMNYSDVLLQSRLRAALKHQSKEKL